MFMLGVCVHVSCVCSGVCCDMVCSGMVWYVLY